VVAVTDTAGVLLERYEYDDYGSPTILAPDGSVRVDAEGRPLSAINNDLLYTGRQYDAETGFYYYRTRYLDPAGGRFTTRDTIGVWGDPMNLGNGYSYVGNNPWTLVDPMGLGGNPTVDEIDAIIAGNRAGCGCHYGSLSAPLAQQAALQATTAANQARISLEAAPAQALLGLTGGTRNTWLDLNAERASMYSAAVAAGALGGAAAYAVAPTVWLMMHNPSTWLFMFGVADFAAAPPGMPGFGQFVPRPGRPTGRDWAAWFRCNYGAENVEWSSLAKLRTEFQKMRDVVKRAWERAWGQKWPRTAEGDDFIPHHDPALSEGVSICDVVPLHPDPHYQMHGGGRTEKPDAPFER